MIRPCIGTALWNTSASRPTSCSACSPRVETARLIDLPPAKPTSRKSERRSYISMENPRRARVSASNEPTGPAPMMLRSATQLLDARAQRVHVGERIVKRRGRDADDVGRAQIADRAARVEARNQLARMIWNAHREHRSALRRSEHFEPHSLQQRFKVCGQSIALAP